MNNMRKYISIFLILVLVVVTLTGCNRDADRKFQEMSDFEQAKIGVMSGSVFHLLAEEYYPEASLYHMNMAKSLEADLL